MVARRTTGLVAGMVLLVEAVGFVVVHGVLATAVGGQRMSMADLDPDAMVAGTWAMGGAMGLFLALCGVALLVVAVRDRAPGRAARVLLIACAVTHGVLGALAVGLVGWGAFAFMMVVLGLVVLSLLAYAPDVIAREAAEPRPPATGPAPV
ncbi:hypothetical protein [Streptomyces sp. NPDC050856]|uniref:hypothetical protein n=1 Tax=Streptomyces sp. NPDC050856 TaxID=3154939 RepID=UPI0033E06F2E